jgi:hypothetical protein
MWLLNTAIRSISSEEKRRQGETLVATSLRSLATNIDRERFDQLERTIERGLGTFVEVGHALFEIQERRLYRTVGHRTFADYVTKRWGLSTAHAYRQIEASKVVDILSPIEELPLPANEAQARELACLVDDPDAVRAVWAQTVRDGDGRVTARAIRERVTARRFGADRLKPAISPPTRAHAESSCPACGHRW